MSEHVIVGAVLLTPGGTPGNDPVRSRRVLE
jgi:hypothetical protein